MVGPRRSHSRGRSRSGSKGSGSGNSTPARSIRAEHFKIDKSGNVYPVNPKT